MRVMVFGKSVLPKNLAFLSLIFLPLFILLSSSAWAADCTNPAGKEGAIRFNKADKNLLFCNGTVWVSPREEAKANCTGGSTPTPTSGPVQCWGDSTYGTGSNIATPSINAKSIQTNLQSACAIKDDNTVQCWGNSFSGGTTPSPVISAKSLISSSFSFCAIKMDDTVHCWGGHISCCGAIAPNPTMRVKSIAMNGHGTACAITSDDTVACWGQPSYGVSTMPAITAKYITTTGFYGHPFYAIKPDDTVACWFDSSGCGTAVPSPATKVKTIVQGSTGSSVCAIKMDDTVECWHIGGASSLYGGTTPSPVISAKSLVTTGYTMCAIKTDDTVQCWGDSTYGTGVVRLPPSGTVKSLFKGQSGICAIKSDDTVACWGDPAYVGATPSPTISAKSLSTNDGTGPAMCAIKLDDSVQCWGNAANGGTTPSPQIEALKISGTWTNMCAIKKTSGGGGPTYTGTWSSGAWGACSSGTQTRTNTCSTGSSSDCNPATQPTTSQSCTSYTGTWNSTAWGACSAAAPSWSTGAWGACSSGTQTRTVTCPSNSGTQTRTNSCSTGNPADCDPATTPTTSQSCTNSSCSGMAPATSQSCCGIVSAPVITPNTSAGCGNSNVTFTTTCSSGFVRRVDPSGAAVDGASPATYTTQIQNIINYTYKCTSNPTVSPICESSLVSLPQVTSTPTAYSVTPATGAVSVKIYLSESDANVQYSLIYIPSGAVIKTLVGNGSTMDFGAQFFPGTYAIRATRPAGCTNMMLNTVVRNPI